MHFRTILGGNGLNLFSEDTFNGDADDAASGIQKHFFLFFLKFDRQFYRQ